MDGWELRAGNILYFAGCFCLRVIQWAGHIFLVRQALLFTAFCGGVAAGGQPAILKETHDERVTKKGGIIIHSFNCAPS